MTVGRGIPDAPTAKRQPVQANKVCTHPVVPPWIATPRSSARNDREGLPHRRGMLKSRGIFDRSLLKKRKA